MNGTTLVIAEQANARLHRLSWEAISAGQNLRTGGLTIVLTGNDLSTLADEIAAKKVDEVLLVEHDLLKHYSADALTSALEQVVKRIQPELIVFPHTYQTRDFAPKLATRFKKSLVSDCVGVISEAEQRIYLRQVFQGKILAQTKTSDDTPQFVTVQAGAFSANDIVEGNGPVAEINAIDVDLSVDDIRTRARAPVRSSKRSVNLTEAQIIVGIGRGIKTPEQVEMARDLAELLGGELAATRPICDEGLLPMERQIGSSGQTVAPKLYLALGISGATQHLVGMNASETIVAINKDPTAPIFKIADYAIVGDVMEIVPPLLKALTNRGAGSGCA